MACLVCGSSTKILQCPCGGALYCGIECQKVDRKAHKPVCKKPPTATPCVVCCGKTVEVALCAAHSAHRACEFKLKSFKIDDCPACVSKGTPAGKYLDASMVFIQFLNKTNSWERFLDQEVLPPARKLLDVARLYSANLDYPPAAYALGKMYHCGYGVLENSGKALDFYNAAGDYVHAKQAIGVVFTEMGEYASSIPYYSAAIELGDLREAYLNRGTMYMTIGDETLSYADLKRVLELNADDARGNANLATWHITFYKPTSVGQDIAFDLFKKALSVDPTLENACTSLAKLYIIKGDSDSMAEAEKLLRASLLKGPALTCLASMLVHKYSAECNKDDSLLFEARLYTTAAAKLNPNTPEPYCCLADIYMAEKNTPLAISTYRSVLSKWPRHYTTLINLAVCLSTDEFDAEVAVLYSSAMLLNPENMDAYGMLSVYFTHHSKLAEARELLEMALRINPDHPDILCYYACVRLQQTPEDKALWIKTFYRALELNPTNTIAHYQLSKCLADPDEAIAHLVKSVKYDSYNCEKWTRLGFQYFMHADGDIGKLHSALEAFDSALKLAPNEAPIVKMIGDCWYSVGMHHEEQGDAKKAMQAFMNVESTSLTFAHAVEKIAAFKNL